MKKVVTSIALMAMLSMSAVQQKNIVEAIFRKLEPIEDFSKIILGKVCNVQENTVAILEIINNLSFSVLDNMCCSGIDTIASGIAGIDSQLDVIESKLDALPNCCSVVEAINSKIDTLSCPAPIAISTAQTISASGSYILCNNITGTITIAASNVVLDLNNYKISAGIVVNSGLDQITIENGVVEGNNGAVDGINVAGGVTNLVINGVTVKNSIIGIDADNVTGGVIDGCVLTMNTTGLQLSSCHKICVNSTTADCNTHAGFDLISSTTNTFIDCKALSTGQGNTTAFNNEVAGFVSLDGYGNIFERCIANSTQALSTTDSNSLIAGFALRGSEGCSKIIECEAANSTTSPSGYTIPYGILLQATLGTDITLTGVPPLPAVTAVGSVDWSPDGQYVAVALATDSNIVVYSFDRVTNIFQQIAAPSPADKPNGAVNSVSWSPDGFSIAIGTGSAMDRYIRVYRFDQANSTLSLIAVPSVADTPAATINTVDWSPDGSFIAAGDAAGGATGVYIYKFNRVSQQLSLVAMAGQPSATYSVDWSPDEQYVAIGNDNGDLIVYSFGPSGSGFALTQVAIYTALMGVGTNSVQWSSDGNYIAIGYDSTQGVQILRFERLSNTLSLIAMKSLATPAVSVDWSPDGRYITVLVDVSFIQIYVFDSATGTITQRINHDTGGLDGMSSVSWSPDGSYLAVGSVNAGMQLQLYQALSFPFHNVITNNTVYCNSGGIFPSGVGISGASICNLIIGNTAYSNPIPASINHPIVPTNYYFVCNVFNQIFGQAPTELQNIALGGCDIISQPANLGLLSQQILYKICNPVLSQLNGISSAVELLSCPAPTAISTAQTISASGSYILCNNITGTITIAASNVVLDLNNYKISAGIVVNSGLDQITLRNGVVEGNNGAVDGIDIAGGVINIAIENVTVKNSIIGIDADNVTSGAIDNCVLTMNTTGLQLSNCHKICVNSTTANCNTQVGFDLISSTTNTFIDCKAISTGQGNIAVSNNNVFGFVSDDGNGNIFERCIANSTQALFTTDSNSLIAGFALRGSEGCSKIIECEAANSTTSPSGFTIPYGILLEGTMEQYSSVTGAQTTGAGSPDSVSWSPDGQYVAVGGNGLLGGNDTQIFRFDRASNSYVSIAGALAVGGVVSVSWSPDGQYVAVGGSGLLGGNNTQILRFDRANNSYVSVAGALGVGGVVTSVSWSPDGQYVAVGGNLILGTITQILRFDRVTNSYISVAGALGASAAVESVSWSPDGQYVAVGGNGLPGGNDTQILRFDRANNSYVSVAGALGAGGQVRTVSWSPDGQYVAVGGNGLLGGNDTQILSALQFPQHNVITNNTVYCNSGAQFPSGVGISGPSICNQIIGNNAYSNPIPSSANHPIVSSDYYFACNVFNQLFGQGPTLLQNIALGGCEVILQKKNEVLLLKQEQKLLYSVIDLLLSHI